MDRTSLGLAIAFLLGCDAGHPLDGMLSTQVTRVSELAQLAPGWEGEIVATVDQSYAGWDVEIGDADGDGQNEILTGSAPNSRLYQFRKRGGVWDTRVLMDQAAGEGAGLVVGVRVVDLDGDGRPEILAGTGQEDNTTARLHVLRTDGESITFQRSLQAPENTSSYTHGLPTADLNGDGRQEIVSSYCGNGEVIRYDVSADLDQLRSHKVLQLSGSGEDVWIQDLDGDGRKEMILSNGFREDAARVEIHDIDPATGDPVLAPRLVLDGYDGQRAFYASLAVGDIDSDGRPELIVGWKLRQDVNRATLIAYHVDAGAFHEVYRLSREDQDLDLGYFEKMMAIADVDGDGRNELLVSTRGDGLTEQIESSHLGHVYIYRIEGGEVRREQLLDFNQDLVELSWLAVGDVDGDGKPEVVLATGRGDRKVSGVSWVLALRRSAKL